MESDSYYCKKLRLMYLINLEKYQKIPFYYDNNVLVNSNEYTYLGVILKPWGSFSSAIGHLCRKARTAIFRIRKMLFFSDKMHIPPHLKLFDSCVKSILLYCSKIWSLDSLVNNRSNLENKYLLFPTC